MSQDKIRMPSSMGGLVRYFDEYRSRISLNPGTVVVLSVIIIIIMIIVHLYGKTFFGV